MNSSQSDGEAVADENMSNLALPVVRSDNVSPQIPWTSCRFIEPFDDGLPAEFALDTRGGFDRRQ